jgi:hypothetical protein
MLPVKNGFTLVAILLGGCTHYILPPPPDLAVQDGVSVQDALPVDDLLEIDHAAPDLASVDDLAIPPDMTDPGVTGCTMTGMVPDELRCTGLYDNWATRSIAPTAKGFVPGFELWSDGAKKSRWIQIPAGKKIDVRDLNNWQFPVDTKLWKQFVVNVGGTDKIVETRFLWRTTDTGVVESDWVHTTYVWSADQQSTMRVSNGMNPVPGTASAAAIPNSTTMPYQGYEIPTEAMCVDCHSGSKGFILGLSAVLAAAPEATGVTYAYLQANNLLTDSAATGNELVPATSLQIPGVAVERAALGKFHANCGVCCHNPHIASSPADQRLRINIDDVTKATPATVMTTDAAMTTINVAADANVYPNDGMTWYRIHPTDVGHSAVYYRDGQRDNSAQMPPICTHANYTLMEQITADWINYMTVGNGYPAPL